MLAPFFYNFSTMMILRRTILLFKFLILIILDLSSANSINDRTYQINEQFKHLTREYHIEKQLNNDLINETYIRMGPIDVHANIGDVASFEVYLSKPIDEPIEITFQCDPKCNTFDIGDLTNITLDRDHMKATLNFTAIYAGHDTILAFIENNRSMDKFNLDYAFVRIRVGHNQFLGILGIVFGWIYFFGWSISFWPQNITNYKRKSVVGLNFDYTILHFTGFLFYSIFNLSLYFSSTVQDEYEAVHPRSEIPVELNDVVYSLHAAAVTSITWTQCMIYERGDQRLSIYGKLFQLCTWSVGSILLVLCFFKVVTWLTFIYYFSYIKLVVTGVKYLPQVYFNFVRKSTAGWTIWMIYLDIVGGSMSMLQMLTIAYNYNDWTTLLGNLPKLGLSFASIFYDIIFLLQEFVFYPNTNNPKMIKRASILTNLSRRRSTLKNIDNSYDHLCKMDSSISSSDSSNVNNTNESSNNAPSFMVHK